MDILNNILKGFSQEVHRNSRNENVKFTLKVLKDINYMNKNEFKKVFMNFYISYSLALLDNAEKVNLNEKMKFMLIENLCNETFEDTILPIVDRYLIDSNKNNNEKPNN